MAKFKLYRAFGCADSGRTIHPQLVVLATQAADQAELLAVMVQAYTAMGKIVTHDRDLLERSATREGLGSLMRALNGEMERLVEGLVHGTTELRDLVLDEVGDW